MRLDKFLCETLGATRKEATRIIKSGTVTVDGVKTKVTSVKVTDDSTVEWDGRELKFHGPRYIMLFKPDGYVCSHEDSTHPSALSLLDEVNLEKLHFAGRLDVDTTGLVLITDDGQWSHKITSPKRKCAKTYRVWLADPIGADYAEKLEAGIQLKSEKDLTMPAVMEIVDEEEHELLLTIHEGKYHQVKRMFAALGNKVEGLHRAQIGGLGLDYSLEPGEYRYLTEEEVEAVFGE
ncbi:MULTISPECIES: 16S rRNA pseudouridine(516) synthase RsuA [Aliivibrio]|uniref:Pseudouridine synthase n=4 Tax=Aliivibrio fischeri TaxID=668 RepID=Q5E6H1_ALIF1|nr:MULTISPECIES: 16S rRNA pseudouridine(516) synthase RsuA [Aliivibrio]AAW85375.1 16S rRNA pseudouridylate 516 synthase [Aliivibrio fischeri ES114]ACH66075.1 ribosomal small subunit pseudouridine synthase A [Aliivibrio fischeri MJ11]EHN71124.1 ribosomal small subunit pseudouridine synthase A [Aliivibrio fischeri SR5]KLU78467.1 16S rRNA pseudouridylate synthase [Aliivibrio fischeri]MBD1568160.1 16S rRNA pseudouridine(516) synthase RsuA [Aliivibrio sp. S10_S31]